MAVRVRLPADRDAGNPDVPGRALVLPGPVRLELTGVGVELVGEVLGRARGPAVFGLAEAVPAGELVVLAGVEPPRLLGLGAPAGPRALAGGQPHLPTAVVEHRLAGVDAHPGLAGLHVDPHDPAVEGLHHAGRRLDLVSREAAAAHPDERAAGPQAQDDALVLSLLVPGVVELAAPVHAHDRPVGELHLRPPVRVGPHAIAREERQVCESLLGAHLGGPLQGDAGLDEPDAAVPVSVLAEGRQGSETAQGGGSDERSGPHGVPPPGAPAPEDIPSKGRAGGG